MTTLATRRSIPYPVRLQRMVVLVALLTSCATTARLSTARLRVGEEITERTVTFATYSVPVPKGEDWGVARDPAVESVSFGTQTTTLLRNKVLGSSEIRVFKVPFSEQGAAMTEEALASGFLEQEHRIMLEEGVARKQYRLGEVKKGVESIEGRKVYSMRYTVEKPGPGLMLIKGEAALFLYFPPDYIARRAFYGFLIMESWEKGSLASPDVDRIRPIVAGFTAR